MFKEYTEEGCLFECKLRRAANFSKCIPWDYPTPKGMDKMDICTMGSNLTLAAFEMKMNEPITPQTCDCLPGCKVVNYKTQG